MHHVVGGALVRDGRVLLGHRSAGRQWYPDVWDFPGGHVESGETESQALARELLEELGVQIGTHDATPILRLESGPDTPGGATRLTIWRIREWHGEPANRAPEEHDDLRWFAADDLPRLALADPSYDGLLDAVLREETS